MSLFQEMEGEAVVIVTNGVFRQVPIYTRGNYLYAKAGGGFIRLMEDGSTSKAKTRFDFLSVSAPLARDSFGRLCTPAVHGATTLTKEKRKQLSLK